MSERWKVVAEFPDYEISDHGRVRRITTYGRAKAGRIRKLARSCGYPAIALTNRDGRRRTFLVHRLVATAFVLRPPGTREVNHVDGTRDNNHFSNLEWVTSSENTVHGYKVGKCCATGESNGQAKLTALVVIKIRASNAPIPELAERFGVSRGTIYDIKARRSWSHLPTGRA